MGGHEHREEPTGGVTPMGIAGRLIHERERLTGMTQEDRVWRAQWLKDQVLTPREPVTIPANTKDLVNPIRRFYKKPLDVLFFKLLQPSIGKDWAMIFRFYTGRILIGVWGLYAGFYYFKYNTNNWESKSGWRIIESRKAVYPGEPGYPAEPQKNKGSDYCDRGFKDSIFAKKYNSDCGPPPEFVF